MLLEFDEAKSAKNLKERGLLYAAVVTPRGEKIRVISLRRANRREERAYAKERQSS